MNLIKNLGTGKIRTAGTGVAKIKYIAISRIEVFAFCKLENLAPNAVNMPILAQKLLAPYLASVPAKKMEEAIAYAREEEKKMAK